jgi:antitoxin PrlF
MARLTVTTRGQVTLSKEHLQHLSVQPGEKLELTLLPNGEVELRAAQPKGRSRISLAVWLGKRMV